MQAGAVPDALLVARCREGDDDAWRELVQRYSRYVYAIAVQAFRLAEHEAEDVFQEVFARVYERLPTLRDPSALRPWIGQVTRRLCVDRIRSGGRELPVMVLGRRVAHRSPKRSRSRVRQRETRLAMVPEGMASASPISW